MIEDIRNKVLEAVDEGMIDKDYLISACLQYLDPDDVKDMLYVNEISLNPGHEDEEE